MFRFSRAFRAAAFALLVLGGCSDCNVMSAGGGCDAALVGGMILAAPVALPASLLDEAEDDAQERRRFQALKAKVAAGDLGALRECSLICEQFYDEVIPPAEQRQVRLAAAQGLVAASGAAPQDDDIVPLAFAYDFLSATTNADGSLGIDGGYIARAYALIRRPDFERIAQTGPWGGRVGFYWVVESVYGRHLYLDLQRQTPAARAAFFEHCSLEVAQRYKTPFDPGRQVICHSAYRLTYNQDPPDTLARRWLSEAW